MNPMQAIFGKIKKALWFVWRHILTLYILSVIIRAIMAGYVSVMNSFVFLSGAIFLDWVKQFIKSNKNFETPSTMNGPFNIAAPLHKRQWRNPELYGSATNFISRDNKIKYD